MANRIHHHQIDVVSRIEVVVPMETKTAQTDAMDVPSRTPPPFDAADE